MKIIVSFLVLSLLGYASASTSPKEVKAGVVAYVEAKIFKLLSKPGVTRAGGGIQCYDKYLPLITAATEDSKSDTEGCISRAASRREDQLNKVKSERESLDSQVQNVEETLNGCLQKTDDLEYLKCLKENSLNLQNTLIEVGKTSSNLSDNLSLSYKNIDDAEDYCIKAVIAKSKSVSDELLAALQNCLMNGLDDGSDGGSEGGSDAGSDGGSEGGSDAGSDGVSDNGADGSSDGGSGDGSNDASNGSSDGGSNGATNGVSDAGSDGGSNGGSNDGSNSDASEGGSDAGSNNGSISGSDDGSDNTPGRGSEGSSKTGVESILNAMPEEDLTP